MLLGSIAEANRAKSVWTKDFGYATVFGDEGDLEAVELLYTSLLVQAARAMLAEPTGRGRATGGSTRSYRQSFLVAYAVRIGERLREAVEVAAEAATGGDSVRRDALLPVLAGRVEAAQEAVEAAYPQVKTTTLSAKDWAGWHAGQQAAEQRRAGPPRPRGLRLGRRRGLTSRYGRAPGPGPGSASAGGDRDDERRPRDRVGDDQALQPEHLAHQLGGHDLGRRALGHDRALAPWPRGGGRSGRPG